VIPFAAFGAIVLAGTAAVDQGQSAPAALTAAWQHGAADAAQAFARVFYVAAGCIAIALIAVALMAERPLQGGRKSAKVRTHNLSLLGAAWAMSAYQQLVCCRHKASAPLQDRDQSIILPRIEN
jgi:hypothetical protein